MRYIKYENQIPNKQWFTCVSQNIKGERVKMIIYDMLFESRSFANVLYLKPFGHHRYFKLLKCIGHTRTKQLHLRNECYRTDWLPYKIIVGRQRIVWIDILKAIYTNYNIRCYWHEISNQVKSWDNITQANQFTNS